MNVLGLMIDNYMKIWKLEAYIESTDDIDRKDIIHELDLNLNRGDGLYLELEDGFKLKLHKKVKED